MRMIGPLEVEIPDLAEPIVGLRAFFLAGDEETPILKSVNGTVWPPNGTGKRPHHDPEFMTARCVERTFVTAAMALAKKDEHPCPSPTGEDHLGMGCGIYAFKATADLAWAYPLHLMERLNPMTARSEVRSIGILWGEVLLWGHVYDHDLGYRAEFAQIKSLYHYPGFGVPLARLQEIADFYGVPVVQQPAEAMVALTAENKERAKLSHSLSVWGIVGMVTQLAWDGAKADVKDAISDAINYVRNPFGRDR